MYIITSHLNLDFDGFAASHLLRLRFQNSVIIFPGAKEGKLRWFTERKPLGLPPDLPLSALEELDNIAGLVVADTSSLKRIGDVASVLDRLDVEQVHVFDHHELPEDPVPAGQIVRGKSGSTTTLVVKYLQDQNIDIPPRLATLGIMGIYEDTDFLTFPETTPEDVEAVAHLLRCGADLSEVATALKHVLTPRQVDLFNRMVPLIERHTIRGRQYAVVQLVSDRFEPDASSVIHQLMEVESLRLFFCLLQMDNKTFLIARNLYPDVDLKRLLGERAKGGGHKNIFTAIFRNQTVFEVRQLLEDVLNDLPSALKAGDLAQPPVVVLPLNTPIRDAFDAMNRLRINSLPTREKESEEMTGAITRQDVDYAMLHELGDHPISSIAQSEVIEVDVSEDVEVIRDRFLNSHAKLMFVRNGENRADRIITRTAAFKQAILVGDTMLKRVSYAERLRRIVSRDVWSLLSIASEVADQMGVELFIVGGFVRDLLLRKANDDLDFVVGQDGIGFARALGERLQAHVAIHEKFKTAVLVTPTGMRLDIATSRFETYRTPGALPEVTSAHVFHDLYRRDFTINAMAIRLNQEGFGDLIDYFGGRRDLKEGIIRVLHSLSFIDDPTRILRAIRFRHRFKFRIGKTTHSLMRSAVEMDLYDRISGFRFQKEFRALFGEPGASLVLEELEEFGGLRFFHKDLVLDPYVRDLATAVDSVVAWYRLLFQEDVQYWVLYLFAILIHANGRQKKTVCRKLVLKKRIARQVLRFRINLRNLEILFDRHDRDVPRSVLFQAMKDVEPEVQLFALAYFDDEKIKRMLSRYITELREFPIHFSGRDVCELGVAESPAVRDWLEQARATVLDHGIADPDEQLEVLHKIVNEGKREADFD